MIKNQTNMAILYYNYNIYNYIFQSHKIHFIENIKLYASAIRLL